MHEKNSDGRGHWTRQSGTTDEAMGNMMQEEEKI